jgi:predicted Rossmann fold nucleotide-binding protein DprA/Smf involved in DNA uptake
MKLAIVGSCCLKDNQEAQDKIEFVISTYKPTEVVSGGAVGVDTMAANYAESVGIPTKIFLPRQKSWPYYKERNIKIAEYCDRLVRIYSSKSNWQRLVLKLRREVR